MNSSQSRDGCCDNEKPTGPSNRHHDEASHSISCICVFDYSNIVLIEFVGRRCMGNSPDTNEALVVYL
jgi:hypothetical protein